MSFRPDLTWRDIQHLCVETANVINPEDPDWEKIANGRKYSYKYGFGLLDAYRYVTAAQAWKLVKPQAWYESMTVQLNNGTFGLDKKFEGGEPIAAGGIESKLVILTEELKASNFEALEHINVKVWIEHKLRGDVEIEITSPGGIKSILSGVRPGDMNGDGFRGWMFMSVKHWSVSHVQIKFPFFQEAQISAGERTQSELGL